MGAVSVRDHSGLTSLLGSSFSTWPAQAGVGECVPLSSSSWMGLPGGVAPLHCEPLCWGLWLPQDLQTPFSRGGVAPHLPSTQASLCASSIAPPQRASPLLSRAVLLAVRYPTGTFRRGLLRSPPTTWSPMRPRLGKTRLLFNFPLPGSGNTKFQTSGIGICILVRFLEIRKPCSLTFLTSRSWWKAPLALLTQ